MLVSFPLFFLILCIELLLFNCFFGVFIKNNLFKPYLPHNKNNLWLLQSRPDQIRILLLNDKV